MPGFAPLRDSGYSTPRLRHCPYDEWLDGVSDALAYRLRSSRTSGPYATAAIRTHLPLSGTTRHALRASMAGSVWEQALHLVQQHPLGTRCDFSAHAFLKALGRSTGKPMHEWLKDAFARLGGCFVEITQSR